MGSVKKSYYMLFPALLMILIALIPLMSILSDVVKLTSLLFFVMKIIYVVALFLLLIINAVLAFILVKAIYMDYELTKSKKIGIILLVVFFSLIVMPYIYHKYILKNVVRPNYLIIYFISIVFLTFVFAFGTNIYIKKINEEKKKVEEREKKRVTYNEKHNLFSFDFKLGYKKSEVGEYDLYVKDDDRSVILTVFTYDINNYEQKTLEEYLAKGVSDIESSKKNAKIYEEKKLTEFEDRKIYSIAYQGNTDKSDTCIYKISVIQFNSNPNFMVYTVAITLKEDYPKLKTELNEILTSVKFIQNN